MDGLARTRVYAPFLGTAQWIYTTKDNTGQAYFNASSFQLLGQTNLNLVFEHQFVCSRKSEEENKKIVDDLAAILKSVGALDIKPYIVIVTPVLEHINVFYNILDVPVPEVDKLTSAIADACTDLIEKLSV